jgi:hypothetical protein
MRILRSYDSGDTVSIDLLRKQKRTTVKWTVPEEDDHYFRMMPKTPREEPSRYRVLPKTEMPAIRIRDVIRTTRAI